MAYDKNLHIDELRDELGNVTQEGTTVTAAKLNHIEDGIEEAHALIGGLASEVDGAGTALTEHMEEAAPHGATVAATAGKLMIRDEAGRSKVADPAVAADVANKGFVEGITGLLSALSTAAKGSIVAAINELVAAVGTKLNASAYTANDVLAKLITVDGSGSQVDGDTVDGIHFRNTSGYLEYSIDGVVWYPVGLRYIKASANSKFERLAEMTHNAATGKLRAVFYPPADGTIKITFDAKVNSGTGTINIASYVPLANMEISAYDSNPAALELVEGTVYTLPAARVTLPSITETTYTPKTATVSVKAGIPVGIYQSATMTVYTQNFKICYDEVYS